MTTALESALATVDAARQAEAAAADRQHSHEHAAEQRNIPEALARLKLERPGLMTVAELEANERQVHLLRLEQEALAAEQRRLSGIVDRARADRLQAEDAVRRLKSRIRQLEAMIPRLENRRLHEAESLRQAEGDVAFWTQRLAGAREEIAAAQAELLALRGGTADITVRDHPISPF